MAGFDTAVTGLSAASTNLDVIGNNIANASTTGFKGTRTQFADIYTSSVVGAGSSNIAGSGVTVRDLSQDFSAGTIEFTNNNLDLAIDGSGFFQVADAGGTNYYTRDGQFELDRDGYIVTSDGNYVQGYGVEDPTASRQDLSLTPIGNLQVTETESPPRTTTNIDLSFNIDSELNPPDNAYDRTDGTTYSYTTTQQTYDSLGNPRTIKFNMVEQSPVVQQFAIDLPAGMVKGGAPGDGTADTIDISGVSITVPDFSDPDPNNWVGGSFDTTTTLGGDGYYHLDNTVLNTIRDADSFHGDNNVDNGQSRIKDVYYTGGTNGQIVVEFYSEFTDSGDLEVNYADTDTPANNGQLQTQSVTRTAGETQSWNFVSDTPALPNGQDAVFTFGGVQITVPAPSPNDPVSVDTIGQRIVARENAIMEGNPDIESIAYDSDANRLTVSYRSSAGDITQPLDLTMASSSGVTSLSANDIFGRAAGSSGEVIPNVVIDGDNSYEGVYRMYAYLDGDQLLDIGKLNEAGSPSADPAPGESEVGPVLISFDTSTGRLSEVNGRSVGANGQAPNLTIRGADPADADTVITLDLSDSTQYASDSIIKDSDQNGYARGDLIGVSFENTGEMIASYSNGQSQTLGVLAVASFDNEAGLASVGSNQWVASQASGDAILNPPGTGLNGTLSSASLESSNVDLSSQLVDLIQAQRDYQANAQTLETLNTVTQTILQI